MSRLLCLRTSSSAAAAAALLSPGPSMSAFLPPAALVRSPSVGIVPCVCCVSTQPCNQQRCHLHHRPHVCASTPSTSTSWPLADALLPMRRLQLHAAPSPPFTSPASSASTCSSSNSSAFRFTSSGARKRPRTTTTATTAAGAAGAPPSTSTSDSAAGGAGAEPASAAPASPSATDPRVPALTSGLGQVIASASNYVRVEVYQLLPNDDPTPPEWRPPHLRQRRQEQQHPPAAEPAEPQIVAAAADPLAESRPRLLLCSVRALLRKLRQEVVVGDVVRVTSIDWREGRGVVSEVLPRSSSLVDPSVANVDHVLLVFALDQPPFEELQVSRFLVAAEAVGLPFTLLLNKADLVRPEQLERRLQQCRSWGYNPIVLSCERGDGVEQVAAALQGRISVVAGPSGAGKSSLINSLRLGRHRPDLVGTGDPRVAAGAASPQPLPPGGVADLAELLPASVLQVSGGAAAATGGADAVFAGGAVSTGGSGGGDEAVTDWASDAETSTDADADAPEFLAVGQLSKIGRGKHTTTSVTLLRLLGGGWLADTPGFGQPGLDDISSQDLGRCFPEVAALTAERPCRFSDCLHVAEPGCSVSGAGLERYPHYLRFLAEIKAREEGDVRQLQRAREEREGATKSRSVRGGGERQEARLDPRRHRRQSRQSAKREGLRAEELLG